MNPGDSPQDRFLTRSNKAINTRDAIFKLLDQNAGLVEDGATSAAAAAAAVGPLLEVADSLREAFAQVEGQTRAMEALAEAMRCTVEGLEACRNYLAISAALRSS